MSGQSGGDSKTQLLDTILDNFSPNAKKQSQPEYEGDGDEEYVNQDKDQSKEFRRYQDERQPRFKGKGRRDRHEAFSGLGTGKDTPSHEYGGAIDRKEAEEIMKSADVPELSPMAQIAGLLLRREHVLKEDAATRSPYYSRIQTTPYSPVSELSKVVRKSRGSAKRPELWSFLENQEDPGVDEEMPDTKKEPQSLRDKLSEVRAQLGVVGDDGRRMAMGEATYRKLERKVKHVRIEDESIEGSPELARWGHILERSMAKKVHGGMEQYQEAKKEKLRAQFDRPSTQLPEEEYNKEAMDVVNRIEEMDKLEQKEKAWKDDLKEPALREFLSQTMDNDLLKQTEREVEDLFNTLEKDEFDSVFQRERVLNAKLKTDAMRMLDPIAAERMPIGSGNMIDTRTILDQFDNEVLPKYQSYTYLSNIFGDTLQTESKEGIKAFLKKMDESEHHHLHMPRKGDMSDRSRMLLLPGTMASEDAQKSELPEYDISTRTLKLKKLAQMQEEETMINGIREYVQEMIDNRQAALRVVQGIKTGRKGRSPVVMYPFREEEAILAINGSLNKEFPDMNSFRATSAIQNQMQSIGTYDRVDKKLLNQQDGFLSYMQKHRRRFRTNRRRVAHARLTNTLKAFSWLRKYNKF